MFIKILKLLFNVRDKSMAAITFAKGQNSS